MSQAIDSLLIIVLLSNFFLLGTSRLRAVINASAFQGIVLGVMMLLHQELNVWSIVLASTAIFIKGILIPTLLQRAMREVAIRREVEPLIGFVSSLLLGALATGAAIAFSGTLPLAPGNVGTLSVPSSLATVMTGFIILTTRKKAITQVVGYLVLENGIFIMGLLLSEALPMLVELGVLLDLLVAIFVLGIMMNHINRTFASLDSSNLANLKE
jgi:hydrogenase-4 component E